MSDQDTDTSVCTNQGTQASNLAQNIGWSLLGITGLGPLFDQSTPLSKLQSATTQERNETQQLINAGLQSFATGEGEIDKTLLDDIRLVNEAMQGYVRLNDEILSERITSNTIYISGTFILTFVVMIFLLISKAF